MNEEDGFSLELDMQNACTYQNKGLVIPQMSNIENGQHGGFLIQEGPIDNTLVQYNLKPIIIKPEHGSGFDLNGLQPELLLENGLQPQHLIENGLQSQHPIEIQGLEMINEPQFYLLESKKKRNPLYMISDGGTFVTAKLGASVGIKLEMTAGYKCNITLHYDDLEFSKDKPVIKCNSHQSNTNIKAAPNIMFTVKGEFPNEVEYQEVDGHSCCQINYEGEYIMQFFCRNSCDQHRKHNKEMSIHVSFSNNISGLTSSSKPKKFKLRVGENVKRDSGYIGAVKAQKRNLDTMMQEFPENQIISKKEKLSQDELDDPCDPISPQPESPVVICIQVSSKNRIELYSKMAEELGDKYTILPDNLLFDISLSDDNLSNNSEYLQQ